MEPHLWKEKTAEKMHGKHKLDFIDKFMLIYHWTNTIPVKIKTCGIDGQQTG